MNSDEAEAPTVGPWEVVPPAREHDQVILAYGGVSVAVHEADIRMSFGGEQNVGLAPEEADELAAALIEVARIARAEQ